MGYLKIEKNNNTFSTPLITDTSIRSPRLLNLNQLNLNNNDDGELYAYYTQTNVREVESSWNTDLIFSISSYTHNTSKTKYNYESQSESLFTTEFDQETIHPASYNNYWAQQHVLISPRSLSIFFNNLEAQYGVYGVNYNYPTISVEQVWTRYVDTLIGTQTQTTITSFQGSANAISWWDYTQTSSQYISQTQNDIKCPLLSTYRSTKKEIINLNGRDCDMYKSTYVEQRLELATLSFFNDSIRTPKTITTVPKTITTWKNSKSRQSAYQANTTAWDTFVADHSTPIKLTLTTKSTTFSNTLVDKLADAASEQGLVFDWVGGIFKGSDVLQNGTKKITQTQNRYLYWSVYKSLADWIIQKDTRYTTFPGLPTRDEDWWNNHWFEQGTCGGHITTLKTYITNQFGKTSTSYTYSTEVQENANPSYYDYVYNNTYSFSISMKNHLQVTCSGTNNSLASISHKEYVRMLQSYTIKTALTQSINKTLENGQTFVNVTGIRTIYPRISVSLSQKVRESIWSRVRSTGSISGSLSYAGTASFPEVKSKYTTTTNTTRSSGYTLTEKSAGGTTLSSGTAIEGNINATTTILAVPLSVPNSTTAAFITHHRSDQVAGLYKETEWRFLKKFLNIKTNNTTLRVEPVRITTPHDFYFFKRGTKKLYIKVASTVTTSQYITETKDNCLIYPLTTDTTASEYSPITLKINNSLAYLATTGTMTTHCTMKVSTVGTNPYPVTLINKTYYPGGYGSSIIDGEFKSFSVISSSQDTDVSQFIRYPDCTRSDAGTSTRDSPRIVRSQCMSKDVTKVDLLSAAYTRIPYLGGMSLHEVTNTIILHYNFSNETLKINHAWSPFLDSRGFQTKAFHNGSIFISGALGGGSAGDISGSAYNGTLFQGTFTSQYLHPAEIITFFPEKTLTLDCTYELTTHNIRI